MKKAKAKEPQITICAKVSDPASIEFLRRFAAVFSAALHKLFVEFIIKGSDFNELKHSFQIEYGINSRVFNSVAYDLKAKWNARQEQYQNTIKTYQNKIKNHKSWIEKRSKEIKKKNAKLESIKLYKARKSSYNRSAKGRKPALTKALKKIHSAELRLDIAVLKRKIGHKKTRIDTLKTKLINAEKRLKSKSLCFGGERLLKKQHNLSKTEFDSHEEWSAFMDFQKKGSSFWIGASCETRGNLNAQYDLQKKNISVRIPAAFETREKHIEIPVSFTDKDMEKLSAAMENNQAIHFRFFEKAKRTRSGLLKKIFKGEVFTGFETEMYCHVTFEAPPAPEQKTHITRGCIGLDLNKNHIALTETDHSGNPVLARNYPLLQKGYSSEQKAAVLGDHVADICDLALSKGKSIVIEDLEFSGKKNNLKLLGKGPQYNYMLSSFAYTKFKDALYSRARKTGVEVKAVNPSYTSIIGACKFAGYQHLTNHQRAALTIARRGRRFSERASLVLCSRGTASIREGNCQSVFHELIKAHQGPKDFWKSNGKKIREQIRDHWLSFDKTPINPRRPSGMRSICLTYWDRGPSCHNSIYRVLSDWCERGGAPPSSA